MKTKIHYLSNFNIDDNRAVYWKVYLKLSKQFVWKTQVFTYDELQQFIAANPDLGTLRAYARKHK